MLGPVKLFLRTTKSIRLRVHNSPIPHVDMLPHFSRNSKLSLWDAYEGYPCVKYVAVTNSTAPRSHVKIVLECTVCALFHTCCIQSHSLPVYTSNPRGQRFIWSDMTKPPFWIFSVTKHYAVKLTASKIGTHVMVWVVTKYGKWCLHKVVIHYWPFPSLLTCCYGWMLSWGIRRRQIEIVCFKAECLRFALFRFPWFWKSSLVTFWYTPIRVIEVSVSVLVWLLTRLCLCFKNLTNGRP